MWEAIVGGVIGAAITSVIGLALWLRTIPGQVAEHDRLIADRDDDLELWIADEQVRLDRRLVRILGEMSKRGLLWSSERNVQRVWAKEEVLHAYRDQERQAERFAEDLLAREGSAHRFYRRWWRRPVPRLRTPAAALDVLDVWREPESYDGETWVAVHDPTARGLDGAKAEAKAASDYQAKFREQEQDRLERERAARKEKEKEKPS